MTGRPAGGGPAGARRRRASAAAGAALAALAAAAGAAAEDWPAWRGPRGDGTSLETAGPPGAGPPRRAWSANVGPGAASPVIAGRTLYAVGWAGAPRPRGNPAGPEVLRAFDLGTGRELWRREMPGRYQGRHRVGDEDAYGGPSATPLADPDSGRLFTLGPDGDLRAWDLRDGGRPLWHVNLYEAYGAGRRPDAGGGVRDFGYTASPRLAGGHLLVEVGAPGGLVAALDPATGRPRWRSEADGPAGHSGGIVLGPGADAAAVLALRELVVFSLAPGREGRTIARVPWATEFACNIPTPAVHGERLLVTSGYNRRRTAALAPSATGAWTAAWESRVHAVVSSPVVRGDRVYVLAGSLACLDARTGGTRWRGGRFGHGTMIATADDRLLVFGEGRLALVEAGPDTAAYRERYAIERVLPGECYPHLALSDGRLAVKDRDGNLAVYAWPAAGEPAVPPP